MFHSPENGIPTLRRERPADAASIRAVLTAAFPTAAEACLVDALRSAGRLTVSLVATRPGASDDDVIGHVALSPITVDDRDAAGLGLAPLAVAPAHQRRGLGAALVRAAIAAARDHGARFVVLLGEPAYYSRFGFLPASSFGLDSEYDAGDAFQAIELVPGALADGRGRVRYAPEFADLE